MNNVHGTTQVTDQQIITIFHLALQVYCSPSLKEHLHNPVMTLLACNIERTVSILCAHGVMCGVVCMNIVCCMCMCVVVCTSALVCAFVCTVPSKWWIQIYKYTISNHTSTKQHIQFWQLLNFFLVTCLQMTV